MRITGLSQTHAEVFEEILRVRRAETLFRFRLPGMHPSTNGALPVVDFGGEDLPPVAVELLQADVAVALLREAVKLYRRGTPRVTFDLEETPA